MTVARRLGLGLGLHFLLLMALLTFHLRTIRHAVNTAHELSEVSANIVLSAARQASRLARIDDAAAKFAVTSDQGYQEQFSTLRTEFSAELDQWATLPASAEESTAISAALAAWAPLRHANIRRTSWEQMRAPLAQVSDAAQSTMRARLDQAATDAARATRLSYLAALGALVLAVLTAWLLSRSITAPLRRLAAGTREVAKGRFGYRLDTRRGDEFAQVADAFNTMTQRLGALDKMKQDFVTSVSHDLKSPLASLRETTTLLLDGVPGSLNAQQRKLLLLQRESADRLGLMIAKLLDLSRLESGLPLSLRPEPIVPLLEAAAAHAHAAGAERGVQVVASLPAEELVVTCDADRVRQLVDNLLENALKFSPRGALVELGARVVDGQVLQFVVADRGPGIPPELRDKVFERFFQTNEGRSVPGRGVGLGLTIVRQIAQAHDGGVVIDGREGGGTAFIVRLPGVEVASGETGEWNASERAPAPPRGVMPAASGVKAQLASCALLMCLGGTMACATGRSGFDEHLREGRWTEAVAAFERDSSLKQDPDALRRLADVHAVPQRPEWDPERAAQLYAQARINSRGRWTMPLSSARSAALVEEVLRMRAAHRTREDELRGRIAGVDAAMAALRVERDSLARIAAASGEEVASRVRTITRLERALQEREAEARSLRRALDRLKAIDLKPQASP